MSAITNWEPIKAFYELLHHSPAYIAEAFGLPLELIEDAIIEKGWQHKGNVDKDVHKKTAALSVLKQQYLQPQFQEIEIILLGKVKEMAKLVDGDSEIYGDVKKVKALIQSYRMLVEQNTMLNAQMTEDAKADEKLKEAEELEEGINGIIEKVKQSFIEE